MSTHQTGFRYCGVLSVYCFDDHRSINYPWLGLWRMSNPKTAQTVNSDEFLLCLHLFPLFVCSSCPPVFHMAQCGPINPVSYSIGVPVESSQGPTQQISPIFFQAPFSPIASHADFLWFQLNVPVILWLSSSPTCPTCTSQNWMKYDEMTFSRTHLWFPGKTMVSCYFSLIFLYELVNQSIA